MTKGCPPGSSLGPTLWLLVMQGWFKIMDEANHTWTTDERDRDPTLADSEEPLARVQAFVNDRDWLSPGFRARSPNVSGTTYGEHARSDSSSQYDAIRAYLKELDITEKVWIGLSKPQKKPSFLWTDFSPLSSEGHWQESLPIGDSQSLCTVMDPATDFLWRALPCGGPEVAAFICELPIPSWSQGPRGCLLTELPSLTVLYIPEQSALELTSDCGLDGTKRIACKGNADREEMMRQLTCVISTEDMEDDKSTKSSTADDFETTSTWDDNSIGDEGKTTKSSTSNADYGMPTRHRRETEDTLSPISTKSSFKEVSTSDVSWQDSHREKVVLTTHFITALDDHLTPTPVTIFDAEKSTESSSIVGASTLSSLEVLEHNTSASVTKRAKTVAATIIPTTGQTEPITVATAAIPETSNKLTTNENPKHDVSEPTSSSSPTQEGNVEDYPSAINQGQLFSFIDNGTMFDMIELNETEHDSDSTKLIRNKGTPASAVPTVLHTSTKSADNDFSMLTKKPFTKKPMQPTKKTSKDPQTKKDLVDKLIPPTQTTKRPLSVDELAENLTKEFEMMPDIRDTSVKLNRTFRKELPPVNDEHSNLESGSQFGVPRVLSFTVSNTLDDTEGYQQDQPVEEANMTSPVLITSSIVKKNEPKIDDIDKKSEVTSESIKEVEKFEITIPIQKSVVSIGTIETSKTPPTTITAIVTSEGSTTTTTTTTAATVHNAIDPRIYMLNHYPNVPKNNHSESIQIHQNTNASAEKSKVLKEHFLPKSLLGDKLKPSESTATSTLHTPTSDGYSPHTFPSDEPKKMNRHRSLQSKQAKARKFYPYFFSRMLG